ncbi:MAG: DUF2182 domain-containing protein [Gammaproteobacteria bacterium]
MSFLVNFDVDDLETAARFYRSAFGLKVGRRFRNTGILLLGYLLVWMGFSILAALAQWRLHTAALLSSFCLIASCTLGCGLLHHRAVLLSGSARGEVNCRFRGIWFD